jgi:alpha-tubulin suppressor-like RCC1 family protein
MRGAEGAFGGSRVGMAACGDLITLAVTEAGALWSCGKGAYGALGHGDNVDRLIPTCVDAQDFDGAKIVTAAAGSYVSTAVTEDGALYTWGTAQNPIDFYDADTPIALGHTDMENKIVSTRVAPHHMQGARVGRCHSLPPQHAFAFAMGMHSRLEGT